MNPREEDVAKAIESQWTAQGVDGVVTGGLFLEVPPADPAPVQPYAVFDVEALTGDDEYTLPAIPGKTFVAHEHITIRVYGTREQVRAGLEAMDRTFPNRVFDVPNSTCQGCLPWQPGQVFRREPRRKAGTDVWQGRRDYELMHERVIQ